MDQRRHVCPEAEAGAALTAPAALAGESGGPTTSQTMVVLGNRLADPGADTLVDHVRVEKPEEGGGIGGSLGAGRVAEPVTPCAPRAALPLRP